MVAALVMLAMACEGKEAVSASASALLPRGQVYEMQGEHLVGRFVPGEEVFLEIPAEFQEKPLTGKVGRIVALRDGRIFVQRGSSEVLEIHRETGAFTSVMTGQIRGSLPESGILFVSSQAEPDDSQHTLYAVDENGMPSPVGYAVTGPVVPVGEDAAVFKEYLSQHPVLWHAADGKTEALNWCRGCKPLIGLAENTFLASWRADDELQLVVADVATGTMKRVNMEGSASGWRPVYYFDDRNDLLVEQVRDRPDQIGVRDCFLVSLRLEDAVLSDARRVDCIAEPFGFLPSPD